MATLLFDGSVSELPQAVARGEDLWIPLAALNEATGFTLRPEGLCRGPVCVPKPRGGAPWVEGERFAVTAFARHQRRPIVCAGDAWSVGPEPTPLFADGEAPDFRLPDLEGREHSLSQYRGQKVLIMTWASW